MSDLPHGQPPSLTRRGFLVGLAAAVPLAACTPGDEPVPTGSAPVQTRLGVAVLGAGGQGGGLATRLADDQRVDLRTVCDPDTERTGALAARLVDAGHPAPGQVTDLRRVLEDPEVHAVAIATPHHWHVLAAIWALQAGKHVYLEKPATHSLDEGQALLAATGASDRVVEVGTQRRSHPGLAEAIAALHAGDIGQVRHARCYSWKRRRSIGPKVLGSWPATLDADLWYGPCPLTPPVRERFHYDWHWFHDYGNGGLGNNGVHRLDVARWGMALPTQMLATASLGGRLGPKDSGQTPNTALTAVQFETGSVLHDLRGLRTAPEAGLDQGMQAGDEVAFVGEGASIVVHRTGGRLVDERGRTVRTYGADAAEVDPIARHLRRFVGACIDEDPTDVAVGPDEGVAAAAMSHAPMAAHRSIAEPGVDLDAVREGFGRLCGSVADPAVDSFLAHVRERSEVSLLRWSDVRAVRDDRVDGASDAFPTRPGYRWEL